MLIDTLRITDPLSSFILPVGVHAVADTCGRVSGGLRRQARRVLHGLLKFDPTQVPSKGAPGFGAGSGAPSVMFGFLKHLWYTGEQKQGLLRCAPAPLYKYGTRFLRAASVGWGIAGAARVHSNNVRVLQNQAADSRQLRAAPSPHGIFCRHFL